MKLSELMASPPNLQQFEATQQAAPTTILVALQALTTIRPVLHLQAAVINLPQAQLIPQLTVILNLRVRLTTTPIGMLLLALVLAVLPMRFRRCTILVELTLVLNCASKTTQELPSQRTHLPAMAMRAHKTLHQAPLTVTVTAKKTPR